MNKCLKNSKKIEICRGTLQRVRKGRAKCRKKDGSERGKKGASKRAVEALSVDYCTRDVFSFTYLVTYSVFLAKAKEVADSP